MKLLLQVYKHVQSLIKVVYILRDIIKKMMVFSPIIFPVCMVKPEQTGRHHDICQG